MKKIFKLIVLFIALITITSCEKKQEEDKKQPNPPIVENPVYSSVNLFLEGVKYGNSLSYEEGKEMVLPTPEKDYYRFLGWYENSEYTGETVDSITNTKTGDLTFYGKFEKIDYRIVYYNYANNIEEVYDKHHLFMGMEYNYTKTDVFRYRSRTLVGWSLTKDGELFITDTIYDDQVLANADETGAVKLYALWEGPYEIEYDLGKDCFINKHALRKAYFTDFYNFIISTDAGAEDLKLKGIANVDEFVKLASNYYGGGTDQMRGIGNIAGQYYLKIEIGGKIEDQPTTHFIGYCYQNGLWSEFIPFLMEFFAYWRTDEGYTTPTNNGNDFFASAWASLVDTAKLFYYNKTTSYCKTPRVVECLENVPGCLKVTSLPTIVDKTDVSLPMIERTGYTFMGWYDNPTFTGEVITVLSKDIKAEVMLYGKWQKNE